MRHEVVGVLVVRKTLAEAERLVHPQRLAVPGTGVQLHRLVAVGGGLVTSLVARIPHKIAMEIMLLGEPIGAQRAYETGMINRVVPKGTHLEVALEMARKIAGNAPLVVQMLKKFATETLNRSPAEIMASTRNTVEEIAKSADCQEGMASFKERRPPVYRGK